MKTTQCKSSVIGKRVKVSLFQGRLTAWGTITDLVKNVWDNGPGTKPVKVEKGVEVYFDSPIYFAGRCYPFMELTANVSDEKGPLAEVELYKPWWKRY